MARPSCEVDVAKRKEPCASGKRGWTDRERAEKVAFTLALANEMKKDRPADRRRCHLYVCPLCEEWHITSQPRRSADAGEPRDRRERRQHRGTDVVKDMRVEDRQRAAQLRGGPSKRDAKATPTKATPTPGSVAQWVHPDGDDGAGEPHP